MEIKVIFNVDYDGEILKEVMFAQLLEEGLAQLKNSPFYVYGIAFDDIFSFEINASGSYIFDNLIQHSGNSTLRIALNDISYQEEIFNLFNNLNCGIETNNLHSFTLLSINIPKEALKHLDRFYSYLQKMETIGILEYEDVFIFSD